MIREFTVPKAGLSKDGNDVRPEGSGVGIHIYHVVFMYAGAEKT